MKWTEGHLKALLEQGKIRGYRFNDKPKEQQKTGKAINSTRPSKFGNKKIEYDGHVFDSTKEYNRYRELLLLLKAGQIGQLRLQVEYELIPKSNTERACIYKADFVYIDSLRGLVIEDVKSEATRKLPTYIIKRKLMLSKFSITITET